MIGNYLNYFEKNERDEDYQSYVSVQLFKSALIYILA